MTHEKAKIWIFTKLLLLAFKISPIKISKKIKKMIALLLAATATVI